MRIRLALPHFREAWHLWSRQHAADAGTRVRILLAQLEPAERRAVLWFGRLARGRNRRACAIVLNHLGNGWLYPLIALPLLWRNDPRAWTVVAASGAAAALAHLIYPKLKRGIARERPFARDSALECLSRPLDRHSFPSGHCMTLAAVLVPLTTAFPQTLAAAVLLWLALAWARLVSAHHYPSDVVAGTLLGALIAWPLAAALVR